ncbi:MAG TPA: hypothetical protein VJ233_04945 [Hyphomicrobiaceae bacterium]|nr:hypothetical protein [Hyphomicrobiaceae bacterium]
MRKVALALACSFALFPLAGTSAEAQTCRDRVTAKGAPSLVRLLARGKARSAWSEKVRDTKRLGDDYASWKNAKNSRINCDKEGSRHVCRASARPCKA